MINEKELIIYLLTTACLVIIYNSCSNAARQGYGYSGYKGFSHHHSVWYHKNYQENFTPSNRETSSNGNNFSKRGLSGGK